MGEGSTELAEVRRRYAEFLRTSREAIENPYYAEEAVRFEVRDGDLLVAPADLRVRSSACGVLLSSERARAQVEVCGVDEVQAKRLVEHMDGEHDAAAIRREGADAFEKLRERAFGVVLFAPLAVAELERRVSACEIVRYPGSPYEVVRSYWANMGDVAERLQSLDDHVRDARMLREFTRGLHVVALAGGGGQSLYRPRSPISRRGGVVPGELLEEAPVLEERDGEVRFVSGPRVGANPIGGAVYQELLAESLAGNDGDDGGLHWGRVVVARAASDDASAAWFCPPRPMTEAHWDALGRELLGATAALSGARRDEGVRLLARFHRHFVRLHPFQAGNQSVVMSVVNHVLRRHLGAGIPHLVLDHLALGLPGRAYERVFSLALDGWLLPGGSARDRTLELVARKRATYRLLDELSVAPSIEAGRELAKANPSVARCALLEL